MSEGAPAIREDELRAQVAWIRALARTLLQDPDAAEDVAQEALLVALERPPRAAVSGASLRRWLSSVTRTLARQFVRGERRRRYRERVAADALAESRRVVERGEMQQRMSELVLGLDEPYRSTILHRYLDGWNASEIAARQGIAPATVRKRLSRGLDKLRQRLDEDYDGDRSAWLMALVPLVRSSGIAAGSTSLIGGIVAMSIHAKIAAALLVVALGLVAFWDRGSDPGGVTAEPDQSAALDAELRPLPAVADSVRLPEESDATRRVVETKEATAATPRGDEIVVRVRVTDRDDRPVPGARFMAYGGGFRTPVDAEGRAEITLDVVARNRLVATTGEILRKLSGVREAGSGEWLGFNVAAPGYSPRVVYEPVEGPAVRELGAIRLHSIGTVAGRVETADGRPVPEALVCAAVSTFHDAVAEYWALHGPGGHNRVNDTFTDERGEFFLDSIPEGAWRIWAGGDGWVWDHSDLLSIDGNYDGPFLRLVVGDIPPENRIRGFVLGPDGEPHEGAVLSLAAADAKTIQFDHAGNSGSDGSFDLLVPASTRWFVRASDWTGALGSATSDELDPGERSVVLRLRSEAGLHLRVVDEEGRAVEMYRVTVTPVGEMNPTYSRSPDLGEEVREVPTPDRPYAVSIIAEGYAPCRLGPFEPGAEREMTCVLVRFRMVRGRLTAGGEPVAKGLVQLAGVSSTRRVDFLQGFPTRLDGSRLRGTHTDLDGAFELPIPATGTYVLFAEARGWASVERGPFELDARRDERVDLTLSVGGAIEGRVLTPTEIDPAGIVVRFCRGDGRVLEARTDAEGSYHREGLTPGPWMVTVSRRASARDPFAGAMGVETREFEHGYLFPWDCEVVEGGTTRFDPEWTSATPGRLRGSLFLDGSSPGTGTVRLTRAGFSALLFPGPIQALDGNGGFAFSDDLEPGDYDLEFTLEESAFAGVRIVQRVTVEAGRNVCDVAFNSTVVEGRVSPARRGSGLCLISYVALGLRTEVPIEPDEDGVFLLRGVGHGPGAVHAQGDGAAFNPSSWPVVLEVDVGGEGIPFLHVE